MEELIEKLKQLRNLSELDNLNEIDTNDLLLAIIKSKTYHLLDGHNIQINLDNQESFNRFAEIFLSEEDYFYYMQRNGFSLSQQDANKLFNFVKDDFQSSQFNTFFRLFYQNENLLNNLVVENEEYFRNYLNTPSVNISKELKYSDHFIKLIIENENFNLIDLTNNPESYSPEHLKMIANHLQTASSIPENLRHLREKFTQYIFQLKDNFRYEEFYHLLTLLIDKYYYDQEFHNSNDSLFTNLVKENFEFLLDIMHGKKFLPKCLIESPTFRDECIRRNRFDLAVQCLLPESIINDENIINGYAQALNISPTTLHSRLKWVENYYKKNNNLFNSMLGTSLKDDIFNLDNKHLERFVNDVEIQQSLAKLNPTQLRVISKILDSYSFKDYDISSMVTDIISNIHSYNQLIDSLDLESLTDKQFKNLVRALQNPNNPYNTNTLIDLDNYLVLKKKVLVDNFNASSLEDNKNNLLQALFNISLEEGQFIYNKFCHSPEMLESLKESELPKENLQQLLLINRILSCTDNTHLAEIYNEMQGQSVYSSELPLGIYLKSVYSNLYNQAIYSPAEREEIYGPKEHIMQETSYKGQSVQVCIPRANFNFLIHVVGGVSGDLANNYAQDWLERPLMQNHFICCSYISEKELFSIADYLSTKIIYGFDNFENGSLLTMSNGDIDTTGKEVSGAYNGAKNVESYNKNIKYFVPSELTKASITKGYGYNEVVLERRDESTTGENIAKRKPSYIIMPVSSIDENTFTLPEELYQNQLSFISPEDRQEITNIIHTEKYGVDKKVAQVLVKYKEIIKQHAIAKNVPLKELAYSYVDLIIKSYNYEECLKASSEFNIPLVVIDREYYFKRMLADSSNYSDEMKPRILNLFLNINESKKQKLYGLIQKGDDVSNLLPPIPSQEQTLAD